MQGEVIGHSPQKYLEILGPWSVLILTSLTLPSSDPEAIRESLKGFLVLSVLQSSVLAQSCPPVGVEDHRSMTSEERYPFGQSTSLVDRNDRERSAAAALPVDREVFRIGLSSQSRGRTLAFQSAP